MKFDFNFITNFTFFKKILVLLLVINLTWSTPTVTVNYQPKKQWKLSKHDLADIKLDIETEVNKLRLTI